MGQYLDAAIKALKASASLSGGNNNSSSSKSKSSPVANKMDTHIKLSQDPSFDMLVLGCGGGPAENDLSAYWVKPAGQAWSEGFVSVDGGGSLRPLH